jgi:hypothetical protein
MRKSTLIIEEINDLEKILSEGRGLLKKNPRDEIIKFSLEDGEYRHSTLISELQEAINYEQRHFIRFVIRNIEKYSSVSIDRFFDSIRSLQDIIGQVSKILYRQDRSLMNLSFNTTFPSSFGVLLSTTIPDNELISKSYCTLDSTFNIFNALNDDKLLMGTLHKELQNKKMLHRFQRFYQIQANYANDVEIIWGDTTKTHHLAHISKERIIYIADTLNKYEDFEDKRLFVNGIIKGISLVRKKIEFSLEGKNISAFAEEENIFKASRLLNREVKIDTIIHQKINEATDDIEEIWRVVNLKTIEPID